MHIKKINGLLNSIQMTHMPTYTKGYLRKNISWGDH